MPSDFLKKLKKTIKDRIGFAEDVRKTRVKDVDQTMRPQPMGEDFTGRRRRKKRRK